MSGFLKTLRVIGLTSVVRCACFVSDFWGFFQCRIITQMKSGFPFLLKSRRGVLSVFIRKFPSLTKVHGIDERSSFKL